MDGWYYSRNGQSVGPIPLAQLKQLTASGDVAPEDPVWHPSLAAWTAARRVPGLVMPRGVRLPAARAPIMPSPASGTGPEAFSDSPDATPTAAVPLPADGSASDTAPALMDEPVMIQAGAAGIHSSSPSSLSALSYRTLAILRRSRLWQMILGAIALLASIATLMSAIIMLVGGTSAGQFLARQRVNPTTLPAGGALSFAIVGFAVVYLVISGLTLLIGIQLLRSFFALGSAISTRREMDLEIALAAQLISWRLIVLLIAVVFGLLVMVTFVAANP
jgi:hypothetical protein